MTTRDVKLCRDCRGTGVRTLTPEVSTGGGGPEVPGGAGARETPGRQIPCSTCGGTGTLWPVPEVRIVWKGEEASREVYSSFLRGGYEILRVNRFDGSLGFLVYLLEETLGKRVFLVLRDPQRGILALHLQDRHSGVAAEVILAREPLRRPREYRAGETLTLCRVAGPGRHRARVPGPGRGSLALHLYRRWLQGPFEPVDLTGSSGLSRLVRELTQRFEQHLGVRFAAAWRNPEERLIALLTVDRDGNWDQVGLVPELWLREQVSFRVSLLRLGESGVPRDGIPEFS